MARDVREVLQAQRRLLDTIAEARGPALRRAYLALVEKLFDGAFRALSPATRLNPGVVEVVKKLFDREEPGFTKALEDLLVTQAMNAGTDSAFNFLQSATELDPLRTQTLVDALWGEVTRLVAARRPGARGLIRKPVANMLVLLLAALLVEVQRAADREQTVAQLKDRFAAVALQHWWRIARISRTAEAWTFNAVRIDATREVGETGYFLRWTELVDDATGEPLDDRVAADSLVLHGQVALPGGVFTMPPNRNVRESEWNRTWAHPPNRPNDRSVLTLWRPGLDVPAWIWRDGERVPLA